MSSIKEHRLGEVELCSMDKAREALHCLLHTILFCRAPGAFKPETVYLNHFELAYARVSGTSVRRSVERAVDALLAEGGLKPAGPELLKGAVVLSFFNRRQNKALFGLVKNEEKCVWEQWMVPILIATTPLPTGDDETSVLERQRADETALNKLVNGPMDHIPDKMYEFEIACASAQAREERIKPSLFTPPTFSHF
jgi:hypothetical protein